MSKPSITLKDGPTVKREFEEWAKYNNHIARLSEPLKYFVQTISMYPTVQVAIYSPKTIDITVKDVKHPISLRIMLKESKVVGPRMRTLVFDRTGSYIQTTSDGSTESVKSLAHAEIVIKDHASQPTNVQVYKVGAHSPAYAGTAKDWPQEWFRGIADLPQEAPIPSDLMSLADTAYHAVDALVRACADEVAPQEPEPLFSPQESAMLKAIVETHATLAIRINSPASDQILLQGILGKLDAIMEVK